MAIDARIKSVRLTSAGEIYLKLEDRPKREGQNAGIAGQTSLICTYEKEFNFHRLVGCDIWGSSETIILGDIKIGKRIGYTGLRFLSNVEKAIDEYYATGPVPRYPVRAKNLH